MKGAPADSARAGRSTAARAGDARDESETPVVVPGVWWVPTPVQDPAMPKQAAADASVPDAGTVSNAGQSSAQSDSVTASDVSAVLQQANVAPALTGASAVSERRAGQKGGDAGEVPTSEPTQASVAPVSEDDGNAKTFTAPSIEGASAPATHHQKVAAQAGAHAIAREPLRRFLQDLINARMTEPEAPGASRQSAAAAESAPPQNEAAAPALTSPRPAQNGERFTAHDTAPQAVAVKSAAAPEDGAFQPSQDHAREQRSGGDGAVRTAASVAHGPTVPVSTLFHAALAAVEADVPPPSAPVIPNEEAVAESIVQSMRMQYREGVGTAVLQLDPGFLGGLKISLHVADGQVNATLHAENPNVRAWLESNEAALRQGLAEQGLNLERLVVASDEPQGQWTPPDDRRRRPERDAPPARKRAARDEDASTFEVMV
jgi:flagellar hook-length control protein FliK